MRKILYISNYRKGLGGINAQVDLLCQHVRAEGYEADIFSTKGNPLARVWKFIKLVCLVPHYDVLHVHGCSDWGMVPVVYGVIAGKIWGKKIIVTYHGGEAAEYFARHGAFAKRWLSRADEVIVLSGFLKKVFDEYQMPCVVIPNIAKLSDAQEHSAYQWDAPRFISVRHLREVYNIPCILRAFERVQQKLPNASLTILGSGPLLEELQKSVRCKVEGGKLREGSVAFVGQVANDEMPKYLAEQDVFLSAPKVDNMPVSVLEAMNAGVQVISSRVGGVPYLIEEEKTGLLFEYDNDQEMAEKMLWASEHVEDAMRMVEAAKTDVQKYSWNNIRKQLLPLYE